MPGGSSCLCRTLNVCMLHWLQARTSPALTRAWVIRAFGALRCHSALWRLGCSRKSVHGHWKPRVFRQSQKSNRVEWRPRAAGQNLCRSGMYMCVCADFIGCCRLGRLRDVCNAYACVYMCICVCVCVCMHVMCACHSVRLVSSLNHFHRISKRPQARSETSSSAF
jgi:hypothetical protein